MRAAETSEGSLAVAPAPIRAPSWPAAMGAASLAVAATYLGYQLWQICFRGRLTYSAEEATAYDALTWASYAPDLLLVLAAMLLLFRRRAGCLLHIAYGITSVVTLGGLVTMDVLGIGPDSAILPNRGLIAILIDNYYEFIRVAYPLCLLFWFARPKIIHQLRNWHHLVASPAPAEPGFRYAGRVWPSAVGAASVALGSISFAMFLSSTVWGLVGSFASSSFDDPFLRLNWYWLHWLGRHETMLFAVVLMPGVFGLSLILAGIALARRWWAAAALHLSIAVMIPAFMLCFWAGMPWDGKPEFFGIFQDRPQILLRLMAVPIFSLYPLIMLVWFSWPGIWRQAFAWYRVSRRRNRRRSRAGRVLTVTARAVCFALIVLLPISAAAWRSWPKAPPGPEVFGQAISLPELDRAHAVGPLSSKQAIVCVSASGLLYLDGRKQSSLDTLQQGLVAKERASLETRFLLQFHGETLLAIDERAPFALVLPLLDMCKSSLSDDWFCATVLVDKPDPSANRWMHDLEGCALHVPLVNLTATPTTSPPPRRVWVRIAAEEMVALDGKPVALSDLSQRLYDVLVRDPGMEVIIDVDGDMPFGMAMAVVNECKRAGVPAYAFPVPATTRPAETQPATTTP